MFASCNSHSNLKTLTLSQLTPVNHAVYKICCFNWLPTKNTVYISRSCLMAMYKVLTGMSFNFGRIAFDHIMQLAQTFDPKFYLAYSSLINQVLQAEHPLILVPSEQPAKVKNYVKDNRAGAKKKKNWRKAAKLAITNIENALAEGGDDLESDDDAV